VLAGNRDKAIEYTGWVGSSVRATYNMLENLALFAPLVLVAQIAGRKHCGDGIWSGAQIFFFARLVYANAA
jgi:uncharacterized MAPEG superfamily protein